MTKEERQEQEDRNRVNRIKQFIRAHLNTPMINSHMSRARGKYLLDCRVYFRKSPVGAIFYTLSHFDGRQKYKEDYRRTDSVPIAYRLEGDPRQGRVMCTTVKDWAFGLHLRDVDLDEDMRQRVAVVRAKWMMLKTE